MNWELQPRLRRLLIDAALIGAGWATILIGTNITTVESRSVGPSWAMVVVGTAVTLLVMLRRGLYVIHPAQPKTDEVASVFTSVVIGASAITVQAAVFDWNIGSWEIILGAAAALLARIVVQGARRELSAPSRSGTGPERVVIIGTGHEAQQLVELITDHPESNFELVGVVGELEVANRNDLAGCWLGPTSRLVDLIELHSVSSAIVTVTGFRGSAFRLISLELFNAGLDVHLTTGVTRTGLGRLGFRSLAHEPLVVMERRLSQPSHLLVKRAVDVVGALVALLLASPIMVVTAVLIWLEDRGPVFYTSERVGRRGEIFEMYKFRSMVVDADRMRPDIEDANERSGPLFKVTNDPRTTRIGRIIRSTSIDELPQLVNVLNGSMSLVGPRPALQGENEHFDEELRDRSVVVPGITGLWQVEARSNASFSVYRRLDLHYVENWSLSLDLQILLATVEQVLVTLVLLPLNRLRRSPTPDGIARPSFSNRPSLSKQGVWGDPVVDLAPTGTD